MTGILLMLVGIVAILAIIGVLLFTGWIISLCGDYSDVNGYGLTAYLVAGFVFWCAIATFALVCICVAFIGHWFLDIFIN